ncbi:alpha-galactosidase [Altererythrobacter lutimaris]|uniref:alpha-galactosidase n=1 Tax=Altererythrobacter lutimaris TaxID=2743979 RepID=A0A850H2D1_9SPHN|nr:alpha-galactosidase [Altererythrobacter lutimaris]NVE93287.1 alpha-galactosidase [Altererythrobacter lutimaris]
MTESVKSCGSLRGENEAKNTLADGENLSFDESVGTAAVPRGDLTGHQFVTLRASGTLVVLEVGPDTAPALLYAGPDIPNAAPNELSVLQTRKHIPGGPTNPVRGSLLNEIGSGVSGPSGLLAHRSGQHWAINLKTFTVEQADERHVVLKCRDITAGIEVRHEFSLTGDSGVLTCATTLINASDEPLNVEWCASLCIPVDSRLSRTLSFTGRWAGEFQIEEIDAFRGSIVRENKAGRTSHDVFPGLFLGTPATQEEQGLAAAFHLSWSGNHRWRVDRQNDGRTIVQMGEMPLPGEIRLAPGEEYRTPDMIACWSRDGFGDVSRRLHYHLATDILEQRHIAKPRPVHYNTWEAVYFDHDMSALHELAEKAAAVGAERFVLDDGWFGGRRSDSSGLGDWWVSDDVYPEGLRPLVDKVHSLGMEFGLWFEPEMVNPDSELYSKHPDWVLRAEGLEAVPFRGQLTLDLTKQEVFEYLFERITGLVAELSIAYIKWDMNRDTNFPASAGRAAMHRQTKAVYKLLAAIRQAHPDLEIESCSSGGARADYGILQHTDRVWTSDNNDARQRQDIQRGASYFLPLRVLGSHVGPKRCHITGRRFTMEYRVATAIFGHMGMELDLREENETDLDVLKAGVALYKKHRDLIHSGEFFRLERSDIINFVGCVSKSKDEALFSWAKTEVDPQMHPARTYFSGLDPAKRYRLKLVWPHQVPAIQGQSIVDAANLAGDGAVFSGSVLMEHGIQAPLVYPDTCLIYHLKAEH